jgi:hypothetical protein
VTIAENPGRRGAQKESPEHARTPVWLAIPELRNSQPEGRDSAVAIGNPISRNRSELETTCRGAFGFGRNELESFCDPHQIRE